jgi:predicted dehydrogenase
VKVAVVGAGYWGPNLIRNLSMQPKLTGLVVCDRDASRLEVIKSRFPQIEATADLDAVLGDPSIAGVAVATPISTHGTLGSRVLEAKKHLFMEKPLAGSVEEARMLVKLAREKERTLMVGHTFEYSPPVIRTKQLIESGDLGRIFFITMTRVNLGLHQRDASVIWDLVPHDYSILFHWLNETPVRISAMGRDCVQRGIPDVAFIHLEFPSGVVAALEVAWLAPSKLRRTAIIGERKMLVYDDTENIEKLKVYDQGVDLRDPETFGEFHLSYRTGDIISPRLPSTEPLKLEMEHWLDCLASGKQPRTNGEVGLRVVEALEATQRALEQQKPVLCDGRRITAD